jgi:hypothetical protein
MFHIINNSVSFNLLQLRKLNIKNKISTESHSCLSKICDENQYTAEEKSKRYLHEK